MQVDYVYGMEQHVNKHHVNYRVQHLVHLYLQALIQPIFKFVQFLVEIA